MAVYVKNYCRNGRIRIILCHEAPLIEGKAVHVAMHLIISHNIAFIIDTEYRSVISAGEVDGRILAPFEHKSVIEAFGISISAHNGVEAIDPEGHRAARAWKHDGGEMSVVQQETVLSGRAISSTHYVAGIIDALSPGLSARRSRRRNGMKGAVVHHKAMLLARVGHKIANNLAEIVDVDGLCGVGAGKPEFEKLPARNEEAVAAGAIVKLANDGPTVIYAECGAIDCAGDG